MLFLLLERMKMLWQISNQALLPRRTSISNLTLTSHLWRKATSPRGQPETWRAWVRIAGERLLLRGADWMQRDCNHRRLTRCCHPESFRKVSTRALAKWVQKVPNKKTNWAEPSLKIHKSTRSMAAIPPLTWIPSPCSLLVAPTSKRKTSASTRTSVIFHQPRVKTVSIPKQPQMVTSLIRAQQPQKIKRTLERLNDCKSWKKSKRNWMNENFNKRRSRAR